MLFNKACFGALVGRTLLCIATACVVAPFAYDLPASAAEPAEPKPYMSLRDLLELGSIAQPTDRWDHNVQLQAESGRIAVASRGFSICSLLIQAQATPEKIEKYDDIGCDENFEITPKNNQRNLHSFSDVFPSRDEIISYFQQVMVKPQFKARYKYNQLAIFFNTPSLINAVLVTEFAKYREVFGDPDQDDIIVVNLQMGDSPYLIGFKFDEEEQRCLLTARSSMPISMKAAFPNKLPDAIKAIYTVDEDCDGSVDVISLFQDDKKGVLFEVSKSRDNLARIESKFAGVSDSRLDDLKKSLHKKDVYYYELLRKFGGTILIGYLVWNKVLDSPKGR